MIKPTIGRIVWYYANKDQLSPKAAIVAKVWTDELIHLAVVEENGTMSAATSVPLIQEDGTIPEQGQYATWMPYQIGQAKKV